MLRVFQSAIDRLLDFLQPIGAWHQLPDARPPAFEMKWRRRGVEFRFGLSVAHALPTSRGKCIEDPELGSVPFGDGRHFRADCILDQVYEVGQYESGRACSWTLTVEGVKGGKTVIRDQVPRLVDIAVGPLTRGFTEEADHYVFAWMHTYEAQQASHRRQLSQV